MRRRNLFDAELKSIERNVESGLIGSPLAAVASYVLDVVVGVRSGLTTGNIAEEEARRVIATVEVMLDGLPNSFGARFAFDGWLIQSIAECWSNDVIALSNMIVPNYRRTWGHITVPVPCTDRVNAHAIDVILFPGDEVLEAIDLLDYPWLGHELGHNVFFRRDQFTTCFRRSLQDRLSGMQVLAVADRGTARSSSLAAAEMIGGVWTPTRDQRNWGHEIAIDLIALWSLGPAFLMAVDDSIERDRVDPFRIDKVHPPYHVRMLALLDAARRLGWSEYTAPVEKRLTEWKAEAPRTYDYVTLADEDLMVAAVTCGLQACEELGLPRLTLERAAQLRNGVRNGATPEEGTELIVSAWLAEREFDEDTFNDWHRRVVSDLANSVTLESPQ